MIRQPSATVEFGDFQTPRSLARSVCRLLVRDGLQPSALIEPTCGIGNLLFAALDEFPSITKAIGVDINATYVGALAEVLQQRPDSTKVRIIQASFFDTNWPDIVKALPDPLLVIGNPPWVTNSQLSALGSTNLPPKVNSQKLTGLDALTGKSNFDISEWMMMRIADWLDGRNALMALLCKTAVARKVLMYAWKNGIDLAKSSIYAVDADKYFECSVDACLLVCHFAPGSRDPNCHVYTSIHNAALSQIIGLRDGQLIANVGSFDRLKHLGGVGPHKWRSGIKHDCARVMELRRKESLYRNGLGELVDLEDNYLYPMLKSSDVAHGRCCTPRYWMLVPQRSIDDDTSAIKETAPKTWRYLQSHAERLDRRGSSIYRDRPRFAVFGVGDYSFAPWKVAISGFYKKPDFRVLGNYDGKPIVLDDTVNFLDCYSEEEADYLASLLNSEIAREFLEALVFWDAKRPITVGLLNRLDLVALARETKTEDIMNGYVAQRGQSGDVGARNKSAEGQLRFSLEF